MTPRLFRVFWRAWLKRSLRLSVLLADPTIHIFVLIPFAIEVFSLVLEGVGR